MSIIKDGEKSHTLTSSECPLQAMRDGCYRWESESPSQFQRLLSSLFANNITLKVQFYVIQYRKEEFIIKAREENILPFTGIEFPSSTFLHSCFSLEFSLIKSSCFSDLIHLAVGTSSYSTGNIYINSSF